MTLSILLVLAAPADAQDKRPPGWDKGKKAGWDGDVPPGWEKKSAKEKEEYLVVFDKCIAELKLHLEARVKLDSGLEINVEVGLDLFKRSCNGGYPVGASADLVKACVELKLPRADAEICLKTCSCESLDKEVDHENLGQWVKDQVQSGKRGQELADCIKAEIDRRHDEKQKGKSGGPHEDKGGGKGKGKGKNK
jgi:hypothetical protein